MTDAGVVDVGAQTVQQVATQVASVQQAAQNQPQFVWWLVIVIAFTLLFAIELFRALPWSDKAKAVKPIGCDLCLTFWGSVGLGALMLWQLGVWMTIFHLPCASGITLMLFALLRYWKGTNLVPPV